jgi:hypothetical protein
MRSWHLASGDNWLARLIEPELLWLSALLPLLVALIYQFHGSI